MILIISSLSDDHTVPVLDRLVAAEADVRLLDLSAFPTGLGLVADYYPGGTRRHRLVSAEEDVDLAAVSAVWWRRPQPFQLHPGLTDPTDAQFAYTECSRAMNGLFRTLDAAWMNDPTRDDEAGYKLYQLRIAQEVGLEVPRTHVTNDPASARAFVTENGLEDTIYKAFLAQPSAWRETRVLTSQELTLLDDVALAPVIFQEYVPADFDLRITVVGDDIFAAAIDASDTDYPTDYRMNLGQAHVEAHDLPADVKARLRAFMDRLGLVYGAIDMRRTPDGRYVFLEINPSGLWLFTEEPTGLPITQAVVDWFLAHDRNAAADTTERAGATDQASAGDETAGRRKARGVRRDEPRGERGRPDRRRTRDHTMEVADESVERDTREGSDDVE